MTVMYTMQTRWNAESVLTMCYGQSSKFDGGGRNGWECLAAAEFNHASASIVRRINRGRGKEAHTGRTQSLSRAGIGTGHKHEVFRDDGGGSNGDRVACINHRGNKGLGVLARKCWTLKHINNEECKWKRNST